MSPLHRLLLPLSTLLLAPLAQAAVEPIALYLDRFNSNEDLRVYVVPTGKVLLVEHISAATSTNKPGSPRIILETGGMDVQNGSEPTMLWGWPVADEYESVHLENPIAVGPKGFVRAHNNQTITYTKLHVLGLLIDEEDLYAMGVDIEVEEVSVLDGRLVADVRLASPRPVRLSSQVSTTGLEAADFGENTTEEKQRQSNPRQWTVSTAADAERKFMTVTAKAVQQ